MELQNGYTGEVFYNVTYDWKYRHGYWQEVKETKIFIRHTMTDTRNQEIKWNVEKSINNPVSFEAAGVKAWDRRDGEGCASLTADVRDLVDLQLLQALNIRFIVSL